MNKSKSQDAVNKKVLEKMVDLSFTPDFPGSFEMVDGKIKVLPDSKKIKAIVKEVKKEIKNKGL